MSGKLRFYISSLRLPEVKIGTLIMTIFMISVVVYLFTQADHTFFRSLRDPLVYNPEGEPELGPTLEMGWGEVVVHKDSGLIIWHIPHGSATAVNWFPVFKVWTWWEFCMLAGTISAAVVGVLIVLWQWFGKRWWIPAVILLCLAAASYAWWFYNTTWHSGEIINDTLVVVVNDEVTLDIPMERMALPRWYEEGYFAAYMGGFGEYRYAIVAQEGFWWGMFASMLLLMAAIILVVVELSFVIPNWYLSQAENRKNLFWILPVAWAIWQKWWQRVRHT